MVSLKDVKFTNHRGEVYNTKYFHLQQKKVLIDFINSLPQGETINIAYCRFDPKVADEIFTIDNYRKFKFIDTHDENINYTLEHNYEVMVNQKNASSLRVYPITIQGLFSSFRDYSNRIISLQLTDYNSDAFLLSDDAGDSDVMLALALIIRRPDLEVIMVNKWADFFRVYTNFFGFLDRECDSFFIYQRDRQYLKNIVFKNKATGLYSNGYFEPCDYEELKDHDRFLLIPGTLGTPEFKETIGEDWYEDCLQYLERMIEEAYNDLEEKRIKPLQEIFEELNRKE